MTDPAGTRTVYLPPGESWVDWWSGAVHAGGRHLRVSQPLDRIPLFVRQGALIPTAPVGDTVGDGPFTDLTLLSFGGGTGRTVIRDVDGDTDVTAVRDGDTVAVTTTGPAPVVRVEFPPVDGAAAPSSVTINGTAA
jgi:alpha-D-xyloside xylohydrolase